MKKKKANAFLDSITLTASLFLVAIAIVITAILLINFRDGFVAADDADVPVEVKAFTTQSIGLVVSGYDHLFFLFLILSWGAALLLSLEIGSNPAYLWLTLALGVFVFIFAAAMVSAFADFTSTDGVTAFVAMFPKLSFIMTHWVKILVCFFVTVAIALFSKTAVTE